MLMLIQEVGSCGPCDFVHTCAQEEADVAGAVCFTHTPRWLLANWPSPSQLGHDMQTTTSLYTFSDQSCAGPRRTLKSLSAQLGRLKTPDIPGDGPSVVRPFSHKLCAGWMWQYRHWMCSLYAVTDWRQVSRILPPATRVQVDHHRLDALQCFHNAIITLHHTHAQISRNKDDPFFITVRTTISRAVGFLNFRKI